MAARNYPLGKHGAIIGKPYQGTHAVAFNKKGGSNNWESENAYDIEVPVGTPVYAVTSGTIGNQIGPGGSGRFAGNRLHLVTSGNEFYYAHLSKIAVHAGETVQAGQLLGYSGSADGVGHLHFAAKKGDPSAWFAAKPQGGKPDVPQEAPVSAPVTTQPQTDSQTTTLPTVGTQAPSDTLPDTLSTTPYEPAPGSGMGSASPFAAELWNRIAAQPGASTDTQLLAQNAALIGG